MLHDETIFSIPLLVLVNDLLENDLLGLLAIGQGNFNSYLPSKKIYQSWTTGRELFQTLNLTV